MKTRTGSLAAYFVLSFAIAVPVFWLYTRQTALLAQLLLLILGSYAPTISALAVVMLSHDPGGAAFWQRLRNWRASKKVYLVAFILPTAAWLLALSIIITWLFIRSDGSVVVCTFFHAVFNTWSQSILAAEGSESTYILVIVFMAAAAAYLDLRYGKSLSPESRSL